VTYDPRSPEAYREFTESLKNSDVGVQVVAKWLRSSGLTVTVPPLRITPSFAERGAYRDGGDLFVQSDGKKPYRLEAKRLGILFTCADDFPYRPFFIVCAKHTHDAADPKPSRYFIVSNDLKYAGVVHVAATFSQWTEGWRGNGPERDGQTLYYFCPLDLVRFYPIPEITNEPTPRCTSAASDCSDRESSD
jgi:hypothetical protein